MKWSAIASSLAVICALVSTLPARAAWPATQYAAVPQRYMAANFSVNYNPASCQGTVAAWPESAKTAMNHTVDILDDLITSSVTIVIDACYGPDDASTLASAGPPANQGLFTKDQVAALPVANRNYPVALANAISGTDNNGATAEISMLVNSTIPWNLDVTPGTASAAEFDFVSTALHELMHGLGILDSFGVDNGTAFFGDDFFTPNIYDDYVVDANGSLLMNRGDGTPELLAALQAGSGNVRWNGPSAVAVNGNRRPTLFAPNPYSQGSSIGHLDDDDVENTGRLMNSATGEGPAARLPSAITLMMLKDIGWTVSEASDYGDLPARYAVTSAADDGARHIRTSLYLGGNISTETDGSPAETAAADSGDDGVARVGTWQDGAGGARVQVSVAGGRGCVSAWVDWNNNGSFADTGESVIAMQPVAAGSVELNFDVPTGTFGGGGTEPTLYARFRLVPDIDGDGDCTATEQGATALGGTVLGGEVEDYRWPEGTAGPRAGLYLPTLWSN